MMIDFVTGFLLGLSIGFCSIYLFVIVALGYLKRRIDDFMPQMLAMGQTVADRASVLAEKDPEA